MVEFIDGSTGTHTVTQDYCSCTGFVTRGKCKHVGVIKMGEMKFSRKIKEAKSSLEAMNNLFGCAPYKSDQIFNLYSPPATGKSLLLDQEAYHFAVNGLNVLYIDTEGSAQTFMQQWSETFKARFGEMEGNIILHQTSDLRDLIRYLGRTSQVAWVSSKAKGKKKKDEEVEMTEVQGGKQEFRSMEEIEEPDILKVIKKEKIDVIILDSISEPITTSFSTGTQNYPARADATACIYGLFIKLQVENNVIVITSSHASSNPTNPYEIHEQLKGGRAAKHHSKCVVFIDKREANEAANIRRLWGVRIPDQESWKKATVAKITDIGYVDINSGTDLQVAFTDAEVKRFNKGVVVEPNTE